MNIKSLNNNCLLWIPLLLLLGLEGYPVYSQDNELIIPYPIIFIHGAGSSSYEAWSVMNNFLVSEYGFKFGGRLDFCLNQDADLKYSKLPEDYYDYTNKDTENTISITIKRQKHKFSFVAI